MEGKATGNRKRIRKRSLRMPARPDDSALMIELIQELYNLSGDAAIALGATRTQRAKALKRASTGKARPRPSKSVLRNHTGMALLLGTWRRDPRYVQADGTPRALPIFGSGATLQSLAKFCVPDLAIEQVVDILCTHSDVTRMNGDRVALLGHSVKITEKTPIASMAWLITQMRHVAETVVFNANIPANAKGGGRFERQIWATLPKKKFDVWAQSVRERLQETSDRVEADLEKEGGASLDDKEKLCGIGLYVFREDGDLG
jgi:hypothetical protein